MKLDGKQKNIIENFFLFEAFPEKDMESVMALFRIESYEKAQPIYTQHSFIKSLGLVLGGEAAVYNESGTLLNILKPGSCFGAAALFSAADEYVTSVIAKKQTTVLFISDIQLRELFLKYPQTSISYISFLSSRIQFLNKKIDAFTSPNIENAVWNWLISHSDISGTVRISMGYAALARSLSVGRASLYRALTELQNTGKIVKKGAEIQICNQYKQEDVL